MLIGHHGSPTGHQQDTVELQDYPIVLYRRTDQSKPNWSYRIKVNYQGRAYYRRSAKTTDLEKAKKVAIDAYHDINAHIRNEYPVFNKTITALAEEVIADWRKQLSIPNGGVSQSTVDIHEGKIRRFWIPFFADKPVNTVRQADIETFWDWRIEYWMNITDPQMIADNRPNIGKRPSSNTLNNERVYFNKIFGKARDQGYLTEKRELDFSPPVKRKTNRRGAFTRKQYENLARSARKYVEADKRYTYERELLRHMILVVVNSGMRPTETINLKWEDLEVGVFNGQPQFRMRVRGKDKRRELTAMWRTKAHLDRWKKIAKHTKPTDYVFAQKNGDKYPSNSLM